MENTPVENLKVGDKITIFSWKERVKEQEMMTPMGPMQMVQHSKSDGLVGDVLEILAIDFPFIAIKILSGQHVGKKGNLDIRECKLKKLRPEYVNALEYEKITAPESTGKKNELKVETVPILPQIIELLQQFEEGKPPKSRKKPRKPDEET